MTRPSKSEMKRILAEKGLDVDELTDQFSKVMPGYGNREFQSNEEKQVEIKNVLGYTQGTREELVAYLNSIEGEFTDFHLDRILEIFDEAIGQD